MTSSVCRCFPGYIDEVRVWTVARSQVELQQYMHTSLTGTEANLVAYWALDEMSGDVVVDSSPTANDGTLSGGYEWAPFACGDIDVDAGPELVSGFELLPATPNPFNPSTEITFMLPVTGPVRLRVHDLRGSLVAELFNGLAESGRHTVVFQAGDLPSGPYVCRLETEQGALSQLVTLVK